MAPILETRRLSKRFGGLRATDGVDLSIDAGEIRCLIGPNGAGKSTLFRLILGTYPPDSGEIRFRGEDVTGFLPYRRVARGMSIKFQVPGIFKDLSVEHNLTIALQQRVGRDTLQRELERLLDVLDLGTARGRRAGELSHGQQQWLEIGMAIALSPSLLLLDEPTAGMSPEETFKTGELIKRLNADGMTMVVIEHDMTFVRQVARRVTVLHLGQIFVEGSMDDIVRNDDVARIYLGRE